MKNKEFILGLDEVSGDLNPGIDLSLNDDNIAFFTSILKPKTMRIWVRTPEIISVLDNNQVEFKADGIIRLNSYLTKLKKVGVKRFLLLDWAFVYPLGYKPSDPWVIPNPKTEKDMYIKFMRLQRSVHFLIASNFTEIEYYESTNEPDGIDGTFLHKNGYDTHKSGPENAEYCYTRDEIEDIILDLNFYSNQGIKWANKDAKMLLPSFWNDEKAPEFIDNLYTKIESGNYPTIKTNRSNKIEDFFEIFSFHPYNLKTVEIDEYWERTQTNLHDIMLKHNDGNRIVWYTEAGWSDFERQSEKDIIGKRFTKLFEVTQKKFPWVETIFPFRLFNLANKPENEGENNFGLVYNEYDWFTPLLPKDSFNSICKCINGEEFDTEQAKLLAKVKEMDFFPGYELIGKGKKILVLGNKFSYQPKAKWNKWNLEENALVTGKTSKDWIHFIFDQTNSSFVVKNIEKYEREIAYQPTLNKLFELKEVKPDVTIIQLGDFFMPSNLNDFSLKNSLISVINNFKQVSDVILISPFIGCEKVNSIYDEVVSETKVKYVNILEFIENSSFIKKTPFLNKEPSLVPTEEVYKYIADETLKLL